MLNNKSPVFLIAVALFGGGHVALNDEVSLQPEQIAGEESQFCKECPVFVKVPQPPMGLRGIKYVAKFELTWREYLESVDDGSCPAPRKVYYGDTDPQDIGPYIENLRINWPIGHLGVDEIECYKAWLEAKVPYMVALPTAAEWRWFSSGERKGAQFPWGNDPLAGQEALPGVPIDPANEFPGIRYEQGGRFVAGVRVGMFEPNSWGLHDLLGNLREVTADRIDGQAFALEHTESKFAQSTKDYDRAIVMGNSRYDEVWRDYGLSRQRSVLIVSGQFSSDVAVRLALIEKGS